MRLYLKILIIILFSFVSVGWIWQSNAVKKNKEGKKLYNEGKIEEALSKWRDAQIDRPNKEELHYNIGGALHQQKKYGDAFKEYEKSLDSKNTELESKTYYNMGNTHYRIGKLPEAIEDYEKCLEVNPDDEDAKYNIEFIKKKMQQEQSQETQEKEEKESKTREDEEKTESEKEEREPREGKEKDKGSEQSEQAREGEDKEGEMSKEDANRLLDALKDDEKELQRQLRTKPAEGRYKVDKDW